MESDSTRVAPLSTTSSGRELRTLLVGPGQVAPQAGCATQWPKRPCKG